MAAKNYYLEDAGSTRLKLDRDRAVIEDAAAHLVHELNLLDRAIKNIESAPHIALRLASCQLTAAVLETKLALAVVSVWNEL